MYIDFNFKLLAELAEIGHSNFGKKYKNRVFGEKWFIFEEKKSPRRLFDLKVSSHRKNLRASFAINRPFRTR